MGCDHKRKTNHADHPRGDLEGEKSVWFTSLVINPSNANP